MDETASVSKRVDEPAVTKISLVHKAIYLQNDLLSKENMNAETKIKQFWGSLDILLAGEVITQNEAYTLFAEFVLRVMSLSYRGL